MVSPLFLVSNKSSGLPPALKQWLRHCCVQSLITQMDSNRNLFITQFHVSLAGSSVAAGKLPQPIPHFPPESGSRSPCCDHLDGVASRPAEVEGSGRIFGGFKMKPLWWEKHHIPKNKNMKRTYVHILLGFAPWFSNIVTPYGHAWPSNTT